MWACYSVYQQKNTPSPTLQSKVVPCSTKLHVQYKAVPFSTKSCSGIASLSKKLKPAVKDGRWYDVGVLQRIPTKNTPSPTLQSKVAPCSTKLHLSTKACLVVVPCSTKVCLVVQSHALQYKVMPCHTKSSFQYKVSPCSTKFCLLV